MTDSMRRTAAWLGSGSSLTAQPMISALTSSMVTSARADPAAWARVSARGRSGGRPPAFDPGHYKERNTVERCFGKLMRFRAVATRYDKRVFMYQATVDVASIRIWLRDPVR
jgi:transposase